MKNQNEINNVSEMNINENKGQNKKKDVYFYLNKLPHELIDVIKDYIPYISLIFTNKNNYIKYHHLLNINHIIPRTLKENYIRDIVRRDLHFVFERIINENIQKWLIIKHYIYRNIIYTNYVYFLKDFCFINESHKCRNILNKFLEENGLCQNQHKKITSKHIRWKN